MDLVWDVYKDNFLKNLSEKKEDLVNGGKSLDLQEFLLTGKDS